MSDAEIAERKRERERIAARVESEVPEFEFDRYSDGWYRFGGWGPWQAEGSLSGRNVYLRFRHNQASMDVWEGTDFVKDGRTVETAVIWPYYPEGHPEHHEHTGAPLDEDIPEMIKRLVARLAPVSEENPTAGMLIGRAVDAMVEAEERGELTWVIKNPDGTSTPLDEVYPRKTEFVEIDPDEFRTS